MPPLRMDTTALGALLMAEYGWDRPDRSASSVPEPRRGQPPDLPDSAGKAPPRAGRHYETRNVTDDGASSPGRLINRALQATSSAPTFPPSSAPSTNSPSKTRQLREQLAYPDPDLVPCPGRW
ncbi:hypothetical protein GCM10022222_39000 [Amycolatopsis ultiminotia]|uniref:Uncharacterized protein n=1 Tax=Amycolatopsis ultiminotia TaxID=543629 RepID=A0ABP6WJJ7_9PSEU